MRCCLRDYRPHHKGTLRRASSLASAKRNAYNSLACRAGLTRVACFRAGERRNNARFLSWEASGERVMAKMGLAPTNKNIVNGRIAACSE